MNILFYGNCQVFAILKTLNLPQTYTIYHIECFNTDITKEDFTNIIQKCDIIITQPINDNYKNVDYLSTSYINKNKNINCKLIIFDSCYFNFYYFDLTYKFFNNELLRKPIDYHYNGMLKSYINGNTIDEYINNFVNNIDLKTNEELETLAGNSLQELLNRNNNIKNEYNNASIISTHDYIKTNYKNKLLFYSMNHPTSYVIQYICEEIINILNIPNTINYTIDIISNPKCILYKCISKVVNFDINNHNPSTLNNKDVHTITQLYYNTYKEINYNEENK